MCTGGSVRSPPYGRIREEGGGVYIKLDNRNGMSGWSGGVEGSRWRAVSHILPFT